MSRLKIYIPFFPVFMITANLKKTLAGTLRPYHTIPYRHYNRVSAPWQQYLQNFIFDLYIKFVIKNQFNFLLHFSAALIFSIKFKSRPQSEYYTLNLYTVKLAKRFQNIFSFFNFYVYAVIFCLLNNFGCFFIHFAAAFEIF